jgi:hypothetical protein
MLRFHNAGQISFSTFCDPRFRIHARFPTGRQGRPKRGIPRLSKRHIRYAHDCKTFAIAASINSIDAMQPSLLPFHSPLLLQV